MTEPVVAEAMDEIPDGAYALAGLVLIGAAVAALVLLPTRRADLLVGMVALVLIASVSGWLFVRKGYGFGEGWFAGIVFFPLAIAFGIWGPRRATTGR